MATGLPLKLWTIDEYEEMIEQGILRDDERVELIRGEIVRMTPIGMRHAGCVAAIQRILGRLPEDVATIWVQSPILLSSNSMPEPDIALLRGSFHPYTKRRPTIADVLLAIEVADTSLRTDRRTKMPLYAEAGIAEAWIVNLEDDTIEVYSDPSSGNYRKSRTIGKGSTLALPGGLPGTISVDEVLG